jgi:UDP-3-O-[3-hydroxymyristoyl] glucosamine N-acyltransferase
MPKIPLSELAGAIGARLEGDPAFEVSGVASLERAGPDDLSFLANPRYAAAALASEAGALVAGRDFPADGRNILRCENPYLGFARAVAMLSPDPPVVAGVHPTSAVEPSASIPPSAAVGPLAVVGAGVELGEDVVVGAGSHLEDGVRVGARTRLFSRVTVHRGTRLGERCVVQSGCVLGADGFGYATDVDGVHHRVPQRGGLTIGNDVDIGANVTIDRGSAGDTVIGDGCKIDNLVHIAHNVRIGRNAMIVAQVGIAGSTVIGDGAVLGGQAGVIGHARIGDRARIGAQAGVIGDVAAGMEVSGYPARPHREQMRAHALFARLPEIFQRLKRLEDRLP